MKSLLIAALMICAFSAKAGVHLKCNVLEVFNEYGYTDDEGNRYGNNAQLDDMGVTLGVVDYVKGYCRPTKRWAKKLKKRGIKFPSELNVRMIGPGIGLRFSGSSFTFSCPLVRKRKFLKGNFYGVKVHATAGAGANVGIFTNRRLGVCTMAGIDLGLGASLSISRLKFDQQIMQ